MAWAPSGVEIWFTAARPRQQSPGPQLHAVSLRGVERTVYRAPDWLVLHDISADGRVLLSRNSIRINVACQRPGDASERELGWLVASFANGLSSDGQTLIFSDGLSGRTPAGNATVFRRGTEGSPAVALGEARGGGRLSPDGQWVLTELGGNLILVPTGAGSTVTLPKGEVARFGGRAWLHDAKRIVFTGDPGNGKPRGYVQEIPAGLPRAFTPEGVSLAGKAAVRDDDSILGRVSARWALFRFRAAMLSLCQRSSLEISRFNGATTAATRGKHLGLAPETGEALQVRRERVRENLERDVASELRVARPIDDAHAAAAERLDDLKGSESSSGCQ